MWSHLRSTLENNGFYFFFLKKTFKKTNEQTYTKQQKQTGQTKTSMDNKRQHKDNQVHPLYISLHAFVNKKPLSFHSVTLGLTRDSES